MYCTRPSGRSDLVSEYSEHRAVGLLPGAQVARSKSPFSKGDLGGLSVRCIARAPSGRSDLVPEYAQHRAVGLLLGEQVARSVSPPSQRGI